MEWEWEKQRARADEERACELASERPTTDDNDDDLTWKGQGDVQVQCTLFSKQTEMSMWMSVYNMRCIYIFRICKHTKHFSTAVEPCTRLIWVRKPPKKTSNPNMHNAFISAVQWNCCMATVLIFGNANNATLPKITQNTHTPNTSRTERNCRSRPRREKTSLEKSQTENKKNAWLPCARFAKSWKMRCRSETPEVNL